MEMLNKIWNMFSRLMTQWHGDSMDRGDELPPMPVEVQEEMRRRVREARNGKVMSLAEARRRLENAVDERPDLFPISSTLGFK